MTNKEFNEKLQEHFDSMNRVGLGELLLFGDDINQFIESDRCKSRLMNVITGICEGYEIPARRFVKIISYEEFKARRGISEAMALGLRLFLLYQCGVDWLNPQRKIIGFSNK